MKNFQEIIYIGVCMGTNTDGEARDNVTRSVQGGLVLMRNSHCMCWLSLHKVFQLFAKG